MTRLLVWRHGRTRWNASERIQGHLDVELDETGLAQAAAAASKLAGLRPDAIVSSDLRRAAATAAVLAGLTGIEVRYDPRLRERYFGTWQGMTSAEVCAVHPAEYARWRAGEHVNGCEVEEADDFTKRVVAALLEAAELAPDGTVVVTCHGGTGKYGVGELLGWPREVLGTIGPLGNCRWIDVRTDPVHGWRMYGYNLD